MDINELIKRFLEETNYQGDKNLMLMLAYGSRVIGTADENSDLDILIITSKNKEYRSARLVDGIIVDITIMPIEEAEHNILYSFATGSTYFESTLKTGMVVIDRYDTYDRLYQLLDSRLNRKRVLDGTLLELAENHFLEFSSGIGNSEVHYYSALELLRKLYHAKSNCSNIQTPKVYDLYFDQKRAKEKYMLKLPNNQFIQDYLRAIQERDKEKQKEWLVKFLREFENQRVILKDSYSFMDDLEISKKLISLNKAIWKCEDMLLQSHPYAYALYHILMGELHTLYETVHGTTLQWNDTMECSNVEMMIRNLENLFCLVDTKHEIDYHDYVIKW